MEEWKFEDFKKMIICAKAHSIDPNNIWESITRVITPKVLWKSISDDNLDFLFYNTFKNHLLSSSDLSKFFMLAHTHGHPWRLFKDDYRELFKCLETPVIDAFWETPFDSLADSVELYRALTGIKESELNWSNLGYCWSREKDIAIKTFGGEHGVLLSGKCDKNSIVACFNYRSEEEIVVDPSNVYDLTVSSY